jgi:transposase InsO family protein
VFERAFREYGLPRVIRTDNGVPFATQAIHGLSFLNVWWMRLGIQHQRIHPGRPQQNGATGGTFRFQHKLLYIANSLVDQHIGLDETDDGIWSIYFNTVPRFVTSATSSRAKSVPPTTAKRIGA